MYIKENDAVREFTDFEVNVKPKEILNLFVLSMNQYKNNETYILIKFSLD